MIIGCTASTQHDDVQGDGEAFLHFVSGDENMTDDEIELGIEHHFNYSNIVWG